MRINELDLDPLREFSGHYVTARGRLAAFLSDLDPLFRRLLTGEGLHAMDNISMLEFDARRRRLYRGAEREYFTLLADVCREGPRNYSEVNAEFLDNERRQQVLRPEKRRGAPEKELSDESAVRLSHSARRLLVRFRPGVRLVRRLRKNGGFASDEAELRKALKSLAPHYMSDEIDAILAGRTIRSAVAHYVA